MAATQSALKVYDQYTGHGFITQLKRCGRAAARYAGKDSFANDPLSGWTHDDLNADTKWKRRCNNRQKSVRDGS
jgi:hypothetical protein